MLKHLKFKQLLYALIAVCLLTRFIFIFGVKQLPVMWDARIYSSSAIGLIHYLKNPDRFGHPDIDSPADSTFFRAQFEYDMTDLIQGEQINWLYYTVPTSTEAQDFIFLSGPIYPIYLAALFYVCPAGDFTLIRILNILIDTLCLFLIVLVARRLLGERAAFLAGLLYIFYLPFILLTGMISPEPMTILMILLATLLVLHWYDKQKAKYVFYTGAILGILALLKPTAVLLFIPFGAALVYDYRKKITILISPVIKAAIPFIIILIPWIIITSAYYGRLSIRDPDYSGANFRSSSSIEYEGYDLDYTDKDFWTAPVLQTITNDPIGYAGLLIKKFARLWEHPYNDFGQSFIFGPQSAKVFHFLIVITSLFGILAFINNSQKGLIFLFLIPLYYTGIHVIFHALARYNLDAMPFMIIASAAVMIEIYDYLSEKTRHRQAGMIIRLSLALAGLIVIFLIPDRIVVPFMGQAGAIMMVMIKTVILLIMLYFLFKELRSHMGRRAVPITILPAMILIITISIPSLSADSWAEWKCRLDSPEQLAGVRIYIPDNFRLQPGEPARIGIDLTGEKGTGQTGHPIGLYINGQRSVLDLDHPPINEFYYKKMTYNVFQSILGVDSIQMPSWRFIPFNPEVFNQLLDEYGYIDIAVDNNNFGPLDLRGAYNIEGQPIVNMPSLTHSSIERYIEKGDPRIWVDYNLSSDSAISYYIENTGNRRIEFDDLSKSPGKQTGRYRIVLEIKRLNEARYYF